VELAARRFSFAARGAPPSQMLRAYILITLARGDH
jgi:hypothetical protein